MAVLDLRLGSSRVFDLAVRLLASYRLSLSAASDVANIHVDQLVSKMAVQEENAAELCETVLGELERGVQLIVHHFPLDSLSLEIKEALADGAEYLIEVVR